MFAGNNGLIFIGIMTAGAVFLAWNGFRAWRRARLIADTPTAKLRSAPQGYVELQGRAKLMDGEPNIAPLTHKPCAWWRYRIEQRGSKNRWSTVERGESDAIFAFSDGSGECVVDPDGAEVTVSNQESWTGSSRRPNGASGLGLLFGGRYRYTEERLHGSEPIYLIGWFRSDQDALDYDKRLALRERLLLLKKDRQRLMQFDANGDGQIDQDEWEAARTAMEREVDEEHARLALNDALDIMGKPPDGRPWVIHAGDAQKVLRGFRIQAFLQLLGSLILGAVIVTVLANR